MSDAVDDRPLPSAEEQLRANENRFRELVELAVDGILIGSPEGRIIWANAAIVEITGRSKEELLGKGIGVLFTPESVARTPLRFDLLRQGQAVASVREVLRPDGTRVAVEMHSKMMPDGTYHSIFHDITQRQRDAEALREREEQLRVIFDTSQAGILLVDARGTIVFANNRMAEMFGTSLETLIGTVYPAHLHESEKSRGDTLMRQLISGEIASVSTERHYIRADGGDFWGYLSGRRLEHPDGSLKALVGSIVDITSRKEAEVEKLEMERRLLHAQKLESLGVLAGGIAHDFNNLLMAILGNLEISLQQLPPQSAARPGLVRAITASEIAAGLAGQMLAYSGRGALAIATMDLNHLVENNVHLLKAAIPKTVSFNLLLDRDLPPIRGDASQLQQVIMNLIINAAEAVGERSGTVTLATGVSECDATCLARNRLDEKPEPGLFAVLEVSDTGCGMDAATQQLLFDPFFTTKFTGRGLGMSAVLGIVRGHRGAIIVESEPDAGTTVRVLLPAARSEPAAPQPETAARTEPPVHPHTGTVLVVDDETLVREVAATMVQALGHRVLTASDGEDALRVFRENAGLIDIVLLDLTMPRLDGGAAAREMLQIRPDVQVILASGYSQHDLSQRFAGLGLAGFIQKPFSLETLNAELQRVLTPAEESPPPTES